MNKAKDVLLNGKNIPCMFHTNYNTKKHKEGITIITWDVQVSSHLYSGFLLLLELKFLAKFALSTHRTKIR